jgi:hypothetical protein
MAGMRAAKRRGRHVGRPRKLTPHKLDHARQLIADGKETRAGAAALLDVDPVTLRRALNGPDDLGGSPQQGESVRPLYGPENGLKKDRCGNQAARGGACRRPACRKSTEGRGKHGIPTMGPVAGYTQPGGTAAMPDNDHQARSSGCSVLREPG